MTPDDEAYELELIEDDWSAWESWIDLIYDADDEPYEFEDS